ncbi:MAG: cyanophycin synthetase, partial [Gemmatimonadota bacterium]|nr:cyanophycin synthetase [Gemmatimonadota bacterium]
DSPYDEQRALASPLVETEKQLDPAELEVTRIRALRGPNYWRLAPVIACDVRLGALEKITSSEIPGFTDRLTAAIPTLASHRCTRGKPGGFVERLNEGTHLPHILEHVALELQSLIENDVSFGRVVPSGDEGVWWLIVEYQEEQVGLRAMKDAVRIVRACISGDSFDTDEIVSDLRSLFESSRLGPSTSAIVEEARRRGIPVRRLNNYSLVQLGLGRNLHRIQATLTDMTSAIGVEIAQDKDDTKRVLENIGLPVPKGDVARTVEGALGIANEIGYPVILKPLAANHGRGISGRIADADALRAGWERSSAYGQRIVVEQFAEGRDHRVLIVDGRLVAAAERVPAHVVGDGKRSVRELIGIANRDPRRGAGHTKILTLLPTDKTTADYLALTALTFDSVPGEGQFVALRATANLSTGGTSIDRTDEMHPDNVTACEMAAGVIGLDIAGIDILTPDISVPFRENNSVIIEVNAGPGIRMHTHPAEGRARNVGAPVIDMLYPPGSDATIPVIAVTGTNGKTTTTRLIAHLFRVSENVVGFTTTDGTYLGNRMVAEGDMTGPFSANIILSNPTVDIAVLETARGGILRAGLGFDECDVGVILNVTADHLGLRGINTVEQLADVKGVVAAVVKREGHAVLNADDPLVFAMRDRTMADIVLFSTRPEGESEEFETHLSRNGIGARIEKDTFVIRRGRLRIPIAPVRDVPLMMGGAARFQRENILAAIATAYVQGMRYDDIRAGLLSFFPSPSLTPGRLNLMRFGHGRVLVDYAHNPAAIAGLIEFVQGLDASKRIGIITAPGDRRDEDLLTVGRLCASLDRVILRDDKYRRGRPPGEISRIIAQGLREGGMREEQMEVLYDEAEALAHALKTMGDNDLVFVLADDVRAVLAQVRLLSSEQTAS